MGKRSRRQDTQSGYDRKRDRSGAYEDVSEADITPPEQEQSTKGELYG